MKQQFFAPLLFAMLVADADAALITFTDRVAFDAALSGNSVVDFDSEIAGTTLSSGSAVGGITFTYDFGGVEMGITDGAQFGGGGPFDTTSPANFLGTDDGAIFQDIDDFDLSFAPANGIGMYFITADTPNMLDDDIRLTVAGVSASLDLLALQQTLGDGSDVYFLGIIDPMATFTDASVTTSHDGFDGFFFYNVDDIVTGNVASGGNVPEPGSFALLVMGACGFAGYRLRRTRRIA